MRSVRHGFTLIELLVVIVIIAALIAILLPALSMARASARSIQCASQFRQLGVATYIYLNDSDGVLPPGELDSDGDGNFNYDAGNWISRLANYVGGNVRGSRFPYMIPTGIMQYVHCPTDPRPLGNDEFVNCYSNVASYGMNWYAFTSGWADDTPSERFAREGVPLAVVKEPSDMLLLADTKVGATAPYKLYNVGGVGFRHLDAANVLYVDGHVAAAQTQALTPPTNDAYLYQAPWCVTLDFR